MTQTDTNPPVTKPRVKKELDLYNLPDLLTVREVAEVLRVSPSPSNAGASAANCRPFASTPAVTAVTKKNKYCGY